MPITNQKNNELHVSFIICVESGGRKLLLWSKESVYIFSRNLHIVVFFHENCQIILIWLQESLFQNTKTQNNFLEKKSYFIHY